MICDSGLAAQLQCVDVERLVEEPTVAGSLLESFVAMELIKQASWSVRQPTPTPYRTHSGEEVDVLLEDRAGRLVGIEVKASSTVGESDFRGLKALSETVGDKLRFGAVLYTGTERVPFGEKFYALPIQSLWATSP